MPRVLRSSILYGGQTISGKLTIDTNANIILNRYDSGSIGGIAAVRVIKCFNLRLRSTITGKILNMNDKDFVAMVNSKQSYAKRMKTIQLLISDLKVQKKKLEIQLGLI